MTFSLAARRTQRQVICATLLCLTVQWCPDLVYPDLVDCRDLVD